VFDGDRGPNTGGMGAYSPAPVLSEDVRREVLSRVVEPTIRGMAAEGAPFRGFLYVGLMVGTGCRSSSSTAVWVIPRRSPSSHG